jgi:hypothetical protein
MQLPTWLFADLRAMRIVGTYNTLNKWIDERGFPAGRMIGKRRHWTPAEVMAWIERQPTAKGRAPFRGNQHMKGGDNAKTP